jgi:amino acid transporter
VLAVPAIVDRLLVMFMPTHRLYTLGVMYWLAFFAFITMVELRSVLKQKEVTRETIAMSVSVYLLLGLCWGLLYILIFQMNPQAFNFGAGPCPSADLVENQQHLFPVFIYFSLTTLATIGYGDITPVTLQARYAAVAEGITGQFYFAILVARLVGVYISRSTSPGVSEEPRTPPS